MGLLDGILNTGQQAKTTLDDLILAFNQPRFNTPGMDLRFIRGGIGDALLNTDRPDPRLVQQQFMPISRELLQGSFDPLNFMLAGQRGVPRQRVGSFAEFLKDPVTGKFLGSQSHKFIQ